MIQHMNNTSCHCGKLDDTAQDALAQIDERQYFTILDRRNVANDHTADVLTQVDAAVTTDAAIAADAPGHNAAATLPIYKVGIACYKTACHVETVLHTP